MLAVPPAGAKPGIARPPLIWSTVTTFLAKTEGWRKVAGETIVPSRSFSVIVASAASIAQASSDPRSAWSSTE